MLETIKAAESRQSKGLATSKEQAYNLLQACVKLHGQQHPQPIRRLHSLLIFAGLDFVEVLCNHLIRLFAASSCLFEAALLFNTVSTPSAHTWSSIVSAHVTLCQPQLALLLYFNSVLAGFQSNKCIVLAALKACTSSSHLLTHGMLIHHVIVGHEEDLYDDISIQNTLIHFYATCGSTDLADALYLFAALPHKSVTSWNAIISGYALISNMPLAMHWLENMQKGCVHPNVMSWGAVISGYVQDNSGICALECFQMMQEEGMKPDKVIFLSALKACGSIGAIQQGRFIHDLILKMELCLSAELGTALVNMYVKCGSFDESLNAFLNLPFREVGPWNALIMGYAQCGSLELALQGIENMKQGGTKPDVVTLTAIIGACVQNEDAFLALALFNKMQAEGIHPNAHTFSSVLKACASMGALKDGRLIHYQLLRSGIQNDTVGNALVDMYAKCGSLEESYKLLTKLPHRNVISWGALIEGYSLCGNVELALRSFDDMLHDGIKPNEAIFATIITACSHAGLVDEGRMYFQLISDSHGIKPNDQHLMCMVDLLARFGLLKEAEILLSNVHLDLNGCRSLLTAGRTYGNIELGRRCFNVSALA